MTSARWEAQPRTFILKLTLVISLILVFLLLVASISAPAHADTTQWVSASSYGSSVSYGSCVVNSGYIYCFAGIGGHGPLYDGTFYAPLSDIGVGAWMSTTSYPLNSIAFESCVTSFGEVYCVGGAFPGVYYAQLSASGVGSWSQAIDSYPVSHAPGSCAAYSFDIYCVGDVSSAPPTDQVYYASLSSGGVSSWMPTTSYPIPISAESCVVDSGYIYCVGGGINPGGELVSSDDVYYAHLLPTGGVGAWTSTTSYPINTLEQSCVLDSGYIYCVGGWSAPADFVDQVYYAQLSASGVGSWTQATNSYPIYVFGQSCVVDSGYIYCVAGQSPDASGQVYFSHLTPPPSTANFTTTLTDTTTMTEASTVTSTSTTTAHAITATATSISTEPATTITSTTTSTATSTVTEQAAATTSTVTQSNLSSSASAVEPSYLLMVTVVLTIILAASFLPVWRRSTSGNHNGI